MSPQYLGLNLPPISVLTSYTVARGSGKARHCPFRKAVCTLTAVPREGTLLPNLSVHWPGLGWAICSHQGLSGQVTEEEIMLKPF